MKRSLITAFVAATAIAALPVPAVAGGLKGVYRRASPAVVLILATDGDAMVAKGTGSIITPNGLVLTNAHVIHNDEAGRPFQKVSVYLKPDKMAGDVKADLSRHYAARVKAFDRTLDLAVLEIEDPPASLAVLGLVNPDEIEIGESVFAIGHPETAGLWTLTTGVISAVMKDVGGVAGKDAFQTETSLNRGNSGGPLLDGRGRIVGVNTAVSRLATDGFPITGISFAIKSSIAKAWLADHGVTIAYAGGGATPATVMATPEASPAVKAQPPAAVQSPPPTRPAPQESAQKPPSAALKESPAPNRPPATRTQPPQIYTESRPYKLTALDRLVEQKMGELDEELEALRRRSEPEEPQQAEAMTQPSTQPIAFITDDDLSKQQAAAKKGLQEVAKQSFQELANGPVIIVISPSQSVTGDRAVEVEIKFDKPADGAEVNMNSMKATYLKFITINITDRLKPYIVGRKIEAKNVKFPRGEHSVGMYIEDAKGRPSTKLITVKVE